MIDLRKLLGWISGVRLFWLLGALFVGNVLCVAWPLVVWPGRPMVKAVALDDQLAFVAGLLWFAGLTAVCAWAVAYLRLERIVRWTLVSGLVIATAVFGSNLGVLLLSNAVLEHPSFHFRFTASRFLWTGVCFALIGRGVLLAIRELRGVRFERDNLELVLAFSESVSLMTKQAILNETVSVVRRLTNADGCLLFLLDPVDDLLKVSAYYFDETVHPREYIDNMVHFPCPRGFGLTGKVAETGEPFVSDDVTRDGRAQRPNGRLAGGPNTVLLLPMKVQGQVIGVLQVTRLGLAQFSRSQVTVCAILANHAAVAMDAGNLYHEVLHASRTDALTGLANARAFRETLEQAVVSKESFSLLMLDADCLKHVNDTMGHLVGDRLLQGLARVMEASAEGIGTAFRYAGDEFLLILPGLHPLEGQAVAERVRADLAALRIPTPAGPVETTVSIGVAGYPMDGQDAETLMRAADLAMYHAKQAGKNQVCLAC